MFFPFDEELSLSSSKLSKESAMAAMWLSIFMPFEHAKSIHDILPEHASMRDLFKGSFLSYWGKIV